MALNDRELLARLILCEAGGEGDDGMRAIATVVMNRVTVDTGEFARISKGGSIRNIILQPGQFVCAREVVSGQYNPQNIYNMNPEQIHYDIADWAMAGGRLVGIDNALFFYNPYRPECPPYFPTNVGVIHNRLGNHCFYIPTSNYPNT